MNTVLSPMACLQARLDYAHHVSKKANRKGSHADDKAICIAQDAHTLLELAKAVREKRIPDPIETPKGWNQHEKEDYIIGYRLGYEDSQKAVLKVLEGK